MRLLLIRHGQTPSNVAGALDTALPGPGLTDLGLQQAAAIPDALAGESVDLVYASLARRAQLTAHPLADSLGRDVQVLPGVHEVQAGDLEMATDSDSILAYLDALHRWCDGELDLRIPGGELGREVLDRFDASIDEVAASGADTVAVVSHGAVIRFWVTVRAVNLGAGFSVNNVLGNTGVVTLSGDPTSGWVAESWMGAPLGGPGVDDDDPYDGPAGHPVGA